ncbi:hypothetical protein QR680_002083 [Steinernema hermaphroditum]|uniref:F-box domain-containing protein n=1 Tax=Steinernema hermaphroditum TaxID=289476 RepID=A0AA39H2V8_9BILA|nr:hypothetical protein QR680_002083 [Steinernema hermaphroditum]
MDSVPYSFIDGVVLLLHNNTLNRLADSISSVSWKQIIDHHSINRCSVFLDVWSAGDEIECAFLQWGTSRVFVKGMKPGRHYVPLEKLEKIGPRFLRFKGVRTTFPRYPLPEANNCILSLKSTSDILKLVRRYAINDELDIISVCDATEFQKSILGCLKEISFQRVLLCYNGIATEHLVRDNIDNNPRLMNLKLYGRWPVSILPSIRKYLLRSNRTAYSGNNLYLTFVVQSDFFKDLLEAWKKGEGTRGCIIYNLPPDAHKYREFMTEDDKGTQYLFVRNESRKALVYCDLSHPAWACIRFYKCSCGEFDCAWKMNLPRLHRF